MHLKWPHANKIFTLDSVNLEKIITYMLVHKLSFYRLHGVTLVYAYINSAES